MENLVGQTLESALDSLKGERVLLTGHTGFKGSWLCAWLESLGCEVTGYSLEPPSTPSHYSLLQPRHRDLRGDVRDLESLFKAFSESRPSVVFHLAAQALVRPSYDAPVETFAANVMGTVNVLEACRRTPGVRSVVIVTSDKCYENREWLWSYREDEPMGGRDPYSASKGCAELVTSSYARSFFNPRDYGRGHETLVATARSGNVIGGGDWALDRIVPDLMRAASEKRSVLIRNPRAVRPWQHVLEPLAGYLMLAAQLLRGEAGFARAWNFGPSGEDAVTVGEIAERAMALWPDLRLEFGSGQGPHEAGLLLLDASMARHRLGWKPAWPLDTGIERTVRWYREYYRDGAARTMADIADYTAAARDGR